MRHREAPRPTECTTATTQDNLGVTYPENKPPPNRPPSGHPTDGTQQRTQRALGRFPHHTTLPQCSYQPASPTTGPDCTHTRASHPRDPTPLTGPRQQATHSQSVVPDPCIQGEARGNRAGQATGAPRPQPRRRHPKAPNTNTQICLARQPRDQLTELQATRTTRNSFPTLRAHRSTPHLNREAVALAILDYPTREPQPKSSIPRH